MQLLLRLLHSHGSVGSMGARDSCLLDGHKHWFASHGNQISLPIFLHGKEPQYKARQTSSEEEGGSGKYSTTSNNGLAVGMDSAKS